MRGGQECLLSQLALFMQLEIDPRLELDECPHLASLRAMASHFRSFLVFTLVSQGWQLSQLRARGFVQF